MAVDFFKPKGKRVEFKNVATLPFIMVESFIV